MMSPTRKLCSDKSFNIKPPLHIWSHSNTIIMTSVLYLSTCERPTTPSCIQNAVWHFSDNHTHKHRARMNALFSSYLESPLQYSCRMPRGGGDGLMGVACWIFPRMLMMLSYESLLLLGFSENRFPLSLVEDWIHGIWKKPWCNSRIIHIPCEKIQYCWWRKRRRACPASQSRRAHF